MRVEDRDDSDRWAAVYTPGQGYFSVQTETMLTWDYVDDDASDEEVHAALSRLVSLAVSYVLGQGEEMRSRRLGLPSLRLHDDEGTVTLKLPMQEGLSFVLRRFRRS
jgi:hypothetical protein